MARRSLRVTKGVPPIRYGYEPTDLDSLESLEQDEKFIDVTGVSNLNNSNEDKSDYESASSSKRTSIRSSQRTSIRSNQQQSSVGSNSQQRLLIEAEQHLQKKRTEAELLKRHADIENIKAADIVLQAEMEYKLRTLEISEQSVSYAESEHSSVPSFVKNDRVKDYIESLNGDTIERSRNNKFMFNVDKEIVLNHHTPESNIKKTISKAVEFKEADKDCFENTDILKNIVSEVNSKNIQYNTTNHQLNVSSNLHRPENSEREDKLALILTKLVEQKQPKVYSCHRRNKELPTFSGSCEDWPMFLSEFNRSTDEESYSDSENLRRLDKSVKGLARETVRALFVSPENVDEIIETLAQTYGRPEWIMMSLLDKARKVSPPYEDKPETFIAFTNTVSNLVVTAQSINQEVFLQNPELLLNLLSKLSPSLKIHWGQFSMLHGSNIENFSHWLKLMRNIVCSTNFPNQSKIQQSSFKNTGTIKKAGVFLVNDTSEDFKKPEKLKSHKKDQKVEYKCLLCETDEHSLDECDDFIKKDVSERSNIVKAFRLCFRCINGKHFGMFCKSRVKCGINNCVGLHHKLLHNENWKEERNEAENIPEVALHHSHLDPKVLLRIIPVRLTGPNGTILTSAFCDEGSVLTMIESDIATKLGIVGSKQPLCMKWTKNIVTHEPNSEVVTVNISEDSDDAKMFTLNNVRTVQNLSLPHQKFDANTMLSEYQHLAAVGDIEKYSDLTPTILIGQKNYHLVMPRTFVEEGAGPIASKSKLGWAIHGPNEISVTENFSFHVCQSTSSDDDLHSLVKENFKLDEAGLYNRAEVFSREDKQAMEIMKSSLKFNGDRYQLPLLWKNEDTPLPESKRNAMKRLECLERKLDKNEKFAEQYCLKINEYVEKGYAKIVEDSDPSKKVWYLPHFGVYNINKPSKLRFVLDAASRSHGKCLNDFLLQGPNLVPSLISVIWNFRIHEIGFSGDLKEMFHQVEIDPKDRSSQRFLFRGMNRVKQPDTYEMNVMIFGAVSSPSMAQFVKNEHVKDLDDKEIKDAIEKYHYVDDYLDGAPTVELAIEKVKKVIDIHKSAGFEMVNWISNSSIILDALPAQILAQGGKSLNFEENQTERVLGLIWNPAGDFLTFSVNFKKIDTDIITGKKIPTKRQVLQVVMSVFDPLQFLAPLMIKAKILLQEIWRSGIGWDVTVADYLYVKWKVWLKELENIEHFKIQRCYLTEPYDINNVELHTFGDASGKAYSAVTYLRYQGTDKIHISYVSGKSRVAPLKHMTIPRMELQAAVLSSRLGSSIQRELNLKIQRCFFWTDSTTVLCWIKSPNKRFKMFVGNRVGEIVEQTDVGNWNWVPTDKNPSDKATRDEPSEESICKNDWLYGPEFLYQSSDQWPVQPQPAQLIGEDVTEEIQLVNVIQIEDTTAPLPDINRFSKYLRLIRSTAWVLRFINNFTAKFSKCSKTAIKNTGELTPLEIETSQNLWIRKVQSDSFYEDIQMLNKKGAVEKRNKLYQLSPTYNEDKLLCLDGRIKAAMVAESVKHPIILDSKHQFTELLIQHYHERCHHVGHDLVCNELRQRYWIINIGAAVKRCFSNCQHCKVRKPKSRIPLMGQLPKTRVSTYARPFTFCGVDYFGPIEVKIGRRIEKRYGVLFTCLTVRAVHLELAASLDTDSAIMAIRRFVARRGCPKELHSDNGTNFKGADKELTNHLLQFDQSKLEREMTTRGIAWHFIPPRSPHMGGSWERMVGVVKCSLQDVLREHHPKEELLKTVLCEAEALVNSRPLTHISTDPDDTECLTPNHFLIGTAGVDQIPGNFGKNELCNRKQWKQAQALVEAFWNKWIKGYLPKLAPRSKWFSKANPLQVGEMVLIKDDEQKRGYYPIGIVIKVFPGEDGQVRAVEVKTTRGLFVRPAVKVFSIDVQAESGEWTHQVGEC